MISFLITCNLGDSQQEEQVEAPKMADTSSQIETQATMPTGLSFKKFNLKAENCNMPFSDGFEMEIDEDWCNTHEIDGLKVSMKEYGIKKELQSNLVF